MKLVFLLLILILIPICGYGQDCRNVLDRELVCFLDEVLTMQTKYDTIPFAERQTRAQKAATRLKDIAVSFGIPTEELDKLIQEYLGDIVEKPSPPPGWDPNDRVGTLLMASKIARRNVARDLAMISYGRRYCHRWDQ